MQLSTFLVSTLAVVAHSAPTDPTLKLKDLSNPTDALDHLSQYFNVLASQVQSASATGEEPTCDLSQAQLPDAPVALPAVSDGLSLHHVAVGRGTQNYTCTSGSASDAPASAGAVATLFNASCVAALYPDLLGVIPGMAVHFDLSDDPQLGATGLSVSGHHFFTEDSVPYFDLDPAGGLQLGVAPTAKDNSTDAPSTAAAGVDGDKAVPWLKLSSVDGATQDIKEVYRVTTAGGSAPATCEGMPESFEVQYSAEYWFFSGQIEDSDDE